TSFASDHRVLSLLADELDVRLGVGTVEAARAEIAELGVWDGERPGPPAVAPAAAHAVGEGEAVLACWRMMLDDGRLQDGEPHLAGTARRPVARLSEATAAEVGLADGSEVRISTGHGSITLPVQITPMADRVVWVPQFSAGSHVHDMLGAVAGAVVSIGGAA
ncbi:MAG: molybdopterin dinucleotide binding domain-containing protein, partial [Actinomycetota bacterium]